MLSPVQNGVLKSLSFLFEYIGEMGRDYVYALVPLLEDALIDRDLVRRRDLAELIVAGGELIVPSGRDLAELIVAGGELS